MNSAETLVSSSSGYPLVTSAAYIYIYISVCVYLCMCQHVSKSHGTANDHCVRMLDPFLSHVSSFQTGVAVSDSRQASASDETSQISFPTMRFG